MKVKTRKAAAKRFKQKKCIFVRKKAYKAHLLRHKSKKQLRGLSKPAFVCLSDIKAVMLMLP